jgi:DNA invertase Pin-like site-specific DNA recombinase
VTLLEELQSLGTGFVSLGEGIDLSPPAGRLELHILAALAEFERARIQERVRAGVARANASGTKLGRPAKVPPYEQLNEVRGLSIRQAASRLGVSRSTVHRWLAEKPL